MRLGAVVAALAVGASGVLVLAGASAGDASSRREPEVLGPGAVTVRLVVRDSPVDGLARTRRSGDSA